MIPLADLHLIGLKPGRVTPWTSGTTANHSWITYRVDKEGPLWRLELHGCKAGRFSTLGDAIETARRLARESAALGRAAMVLYRDEATIMRREAYPARR